MRKFNRLITFMSCLILVTMLLALVPLPVSAGKPLAVSTDKASDITTTSATLNGDLDSLGTASTVDVSFVWGTTSVKHTPGSYPNETDAQAMNVTGAFSFNLSGLDVDTTYYFRAKAVGGIHVTIYGNEKNFTPLALTPPSVSTNDATNVTANSATLNGDLEGLGTASSVNVSFVWRTTSGSYSNNTTAQAMNTTGTFSSDLTGLDLNTTYYFKAKAVGDGTSYGKEQRFTPGTTPPSVSTNNPTNVTTNSATLNGYLKDMGAASTVDVTFVWGTTSVKHTPGSYPNETDAQAMNVTGAFSFNVTGLNPDTTYYFKAKAVGDGTSYGKEKSFTTTTTLPKVHTNDATNVTANSATLNGDLKDRGTATSVDVSFVWGTTPGSYPNETVPPEAMNTPGLFSFDLNGLLAPGTTYYFRAKADGGIHGIRCGGEKSFTTGTVPSTVTLTAELIQIPADGTSVSTITADVRDKDGNPVSDGTIVRFTTNKGSFVGGVLTIDKETVGGIATAELKSILSTATVIATITAEANGSKGATAVFFIEAGGTEVIERKVEITASGEYTVDAKSEADTEVTKSGDGTPTVTVAKYESNPGGTIPGGFTAADEYIDVHLDSSEGVDQIEIKNYYTAAQVAGLDESSLRMRWWDGESWVPCSDSGLNTNDVNGYSGYVWAIITASTTPNLTDLSGAVFGIIGTSPPTEGEEGEAEGEAGGGGGGGALGYWVVIIDNLGKISKVKVSSSGELLESLKASDAEGQIVLELDRGTKILCSTGRVPQRLEIKTIQIAPPQDMVVLGQAYRLDAYLYKYSESPSLFTISPPGKLALSYDLSELPPNSLSVFTAYYDTQKGWVELTSGDVTKTGKLTVEVSAPVIFTIIVKLGPPPPPPPAPPEPCFRPSNLVIEPGEAKPGQEITISLIVTNIGSAAGTCTLELKVDGELRSVKSVTLEPGESQVVSFSIIEAMEGEHMVEIADLGGDFTIVIISRPWWLLSTMGVIPIAVFAERRRRWKQRVEWSTGLKTKDWLVR